PQNLEESLSLWRAAISALPDGHPDKASYQSNLSAVYLARYQLRNDMEDLDKSILAIRYAIRGTPTDDMHWVVYKYMASSLYYKRWLKTTQKEDLDRAIEAGRQSLAALPSKHRYSSKYQAELATKLLARYEERGDLKDVDEAIELSKDAAVTFAHASYPAERTTTPSNRLVALSQAFLKRYEKTDEMSDLDEAIKHARQAATMADKSRSAERHFVHFNLSSLIYTRFERLATLEDLDDSITHSTIAIDATPGSKDQKDREELAEKLSDLSSRHLTRFEFQRTPADLDAAVNYARTALDLRKAGDGDGPLALSAHPPARYALALALFRRFEQVGDIKDLDGALKNAQLAYDAVATPMTSPVKNSFGSPTSKTFGRAAP
ncbi:1419_t:CDS:1, partial [Acaulospora colombiana]